MKTQTERDIESLRRGFIFPAGEFALDVTPATTTTVTSRGCSTTSVVIPVPLDAGAATLGVPRIVPGNGSFVVHHAASASTRTYRYAVLTPIA